MKNKIFLNIIFFSLWAFGGLAQSSNIRINHYSFEEGISHRLITKIEKDTAGFVWLGTPNGLNRFDGYEFLSFSNYASSLTQLSENNIEDLVLLSSGNLAITYTGNNRLVDIFNPISFELNSISLNEENGLKGRILDVFIEKNGCFFVLTKLENQFLIYQLNEQNKFVLALEFALLDEFGQQEEAIRFFKRKNGDFLLFHPNFGIQLISKTKKKYLETDGVAYSLNQSLHLTYLKEDQQQRLWLSIAEYPGVFLLDEASSIFKLFETPLGAVTIARLWEDEKGNLLFGETNKSTFPAVKRLYLLDTQGNWDDFSYFMQIGKYIIAANSKDFYNTTLASTDVGLKVIRNWTPSVQSFLNMEVKDGNRNRVMRGIVSDGADKLFLAEESGDCYELNIQTDVIRPLPLKDIRNGRELKLNCTNQLFFDKKTGKLWGHTCEGDFGSAYLMEIDTATWKVKLHPFKKKIRSFCMDKNDVFWLVCANDANDAEIFYFNPTTAEKRTYRNSEGNNPIKGAYPTSITTDKNGQLIISTYRGLFTIQPEQQISDVLNKDAGLSSNQIYATYETDNNLLLLGTNRGLNVFNKTTQNNEIFLREDGLSSNEVYSIYPANKPNSYWLGTIYGLSFLDLNKKSFKTFFEKDGLTHNEFNRFSSFRDKNGRYYFGGVNGINAFYEEDLVNLGPASKPILSKVQYYDSDKEQIHLQYDNLPLLDRIILQPKDRGLELFFNIPEYADPKSNQFMYRLLGDTEDWKIIGNQNYLTYNALPVGTYKLQIKGAGPIGNWSEEVLEIDLIQTQAFHKSWQFWVICMVLLACLIQFFNQYKLEQKIKLERIRTKLSSDLHDEVSGLLAGIAMQSEMLEMQEKEEKNKILLNKIATTSRSAMSRMGDVIWSIDSRKDKIQDLIARMTEHAMDILDPLEIDWEMKVEKINLDKKIPFLLRQNLYFIFKEAINNIGKHANPNKVLIKIGHEKHHFVLSIFNDGEKKIDMRKSNKTGQGLLNMEMRAKKIDAHLERNLEGGYGIILKRKRIS